MIDIVVPAEQEGAHAVVRAWLRQVGDRVSLHDPLVELETEKVTQEVSAPAAGVLAEILLATEAEATPGAVLGRLRPLDATDPAPPPPGLSPAVRQAAQASGIDPGTVAGTGREGRVTRADMDAAAAARIAQPAHDTVVPHDRMRRAIAAMTVQSVTVAPHVTAVFEADWTAVMAHREAQAAAGRPKSTLTAYVLAAAAAAMQAAAAVNSRWHEDRLELLADINIGVGTALGEAGLVVPVIRRVQDLDLGQIATRLGTLAAAARAGTLTAEDVRGGTFTVSNHGVSGSLLATPIIIVQPQSAILGVGKLERRVVVRTAAGVDSIQIRPMCYVSLTIDHRVLDAHQTNAWLTRFVQVVEHWPA